MVCSATPSVSSGLQLVELGPAAETNRLFNSSSPRNKYTCYPLGQLAQHTSCIRERQRREAAPTGGRVGSRRSQSLLSAVLSGQRLELDCLKACGGSMAARVTRTRRHRAMPALSCLVSAIDRERAASGKTMSGRPVTVSLHHACRSNMYIARHWVRISKDEVCSPRSGGVVSSFQDQVALLPGLRA